MHIPVLAYRFAGITQAIKTWNIQASIKNITREQKYAKQTQMVYALVELTRRITIITMIININ